MTTDYLQTVAQVPLRHRVGEIVRFVLRMLDVKDWLLIRKLRKENKLFYIEELRDAFEGQDVFAFGTGGSIANLQDFERVQKKNTLFLTTGPLYCYMTYGFVPSIWLVHNPPSVEVLMREMEKQGLTGKIDFSQTLIFVPANTSHSKNIHFSSKVFKQFRKMINNDAVFVLYHEKFKGYLPNDPDIGNYLNKRAPIMPIMGSAVENIFLPFLHYIGVRNIYFSGVDHMDTGHFWDRDELYGQSIGKKLVFSDIQPDAYIEECVETAKRRMAEVGDVNVYRLEKEETILQGYTYGDFDEALKNATDKVAVTTLKHTV